MWKTILFDLDGTLTDPGEGITGCVQRTLAHYGIQVTDKEQLARFVGPPLREGFKRFYGFDDVRAQEAAGIYQGHFRELGVAATQVYPGIPQLLAALKEGEKTLMVATSKPLFFAEQILDRFSLTGYFTFVSGAELDGRRSRKSEVIAHALDAMGIVDRDGLVMVGDREHDVNGAKEMGIDSVGVLYGYGSREEMEEAGADYIVSTVAELGDLLLR